MAEAIYKFWDKHNLQCIAYSIHLPALTISGKSISSALELKLKLIDLGKFKRKLENYEKYLYLISNHRNTPQPHISFKRRYV